MEKEKYQPKKHEQIYESLDKVEKLAADRVIQGRCYDLLVYDYVHFDENDTAQGGPSMRYLYDYGRRQIDNIIENNKNDFPDPDKSAKQLNDY